MLIRAKGGISTDVGWSSVFMDGGDGIGVRYPGNLTTGRALTIFFLQHFQLMAQLGLILATSYALPGASSSVPNSAASTASRCSLTTASGRAGGGPGRRGPDAISASGPGLFATHGGSGAGCLPLTLGRVLVAVGEGCVMVEVMVRRGVLVIRGLTVGQTGGEAPIRGRSGEVRVLLVLSWV